jgi:hypothetical protein
VSKCERCAAPLWFHERGKTTVCVLCAAHLGIRRICDRFPDSHYARLIAEYRDPISTGGELVSLRE